MKLSQDRIEKIIRYLDLGRHWARHAIEWCDCVEEALKELESFRRSARDGCFGLNWESALEEIAKNNQLAADALKECEIHRFDMGRLWVQPRNDHATASVRLFSGIVKKILSDRFRHEFRVRII